MSNLAAWNSHLKEFNLYSNLQIKEEAMMSRIKDAEMSQTVAEMKQRIAELEIQVSLLECDLPYLMSA